MDIKQTLNNCIVQLGSMPIRVDQHYTIGQPVVNVIQALGQIIQELKKDDDNDKQGE